MHLAPALNSEAWKTGTPPVQRNDEQKQKREREKKEKGRKADEKKKKGVDESDRSSVIKGGGMPAFERRRKLVSAWTRPFFHRA